MRLLPAALLAASLSVAPAAKPHDTISHDPEACLTLAKLAYKVVQLRVSGVAWEPIQTEVLEGIKESKGNPQALVNSVEDEGLVIGVLEAVYQSPATDPVQVGRAIYGACMGEAGKISHSPQPSNLEYSHV